jgi:hypothetical protein
MVEVATDGTLSAAVTGGFFFGSMPTSYPDEEIPTLDLPVPVANSNFVARISLFDVNALLWGIYCENTFNAVYDAQSSSHPQEWNTTFFEKSLHALYEYSPGAQFRMNAAAVPPTGWSAPHLSTEPAWIVTRVALDRVDCPDDVRSKLETDGLLDVMYTSAADLTDALTAALGEVDWVATISKAAATTALVCAAAVQVDLWVPKDGAERHPITATVAPSLHAADFEIIDLDGGRQALQLVLSEIEAPDSPSVQRFVARDEFDVPPQDQWEVWYESLFDRCVTDFLDALNPQDGMHSIPIPNVDSLVLENSQIIVPAYDAPVPFFDVSGNLAIR